MKFLVLIFLFGVTNGHFDNEINLECRGTKFENVTLTAYYPDFNNDEGFLDKKGENLSTLQDYLDNRAEFVTLAMDEGLKLPYGTKVCIPELNQHFGHRIILQVRDTSSDLRGSGYKRADVCVRSEIDSYDVTVNRQVTLVFV
ncbi:uncharacterized protein LOC123005327 [Tribolium madens]|uniref:uncharacterized protein LOC123005327 n=1 Tax=Tribolium madens TaxID=41895 RepID=UPI001CF766E2|nr:uncharacterized protein LOC123005327 [Tribolium madens]